jgi:hypothetical protein
MSLMAEVQSDFWYDRFRPNMVFRGYRNFDVLVIRCTIKPQHLEVSVLHPFLHRNVGHVMFRALKDLTIRLAMIFWQRFLFVISIRHGGTLGTPPSL